MMVPEAEFLKRYFFVVAHPPVLCYNSALIFTYRMYRRKEAA